MVTAREKRIGFVATPPEIARLLTTWAVRRPSDLVLDVGTGEGVFTFAAHDRLRALGATEPEALDQLHGAERDAEIFAAFAEEARTTIGTVPRHVRRDDFFDVDFPTVDAVVGNPPYVGRLYLHEIDSIRRRALPFFGLRGKVGRLADLYCYFLLYAGRHLRPGGRLAVIVSSSWLDVDYGIGLKQWLLSEFHIRAVVAFERRVFPSALVKAVLLFAERRPTENRPAEEPVRFIRLGTWPDGIAADDLIDGRWSGGVDVAEVRQEELDPEESWSVYLRKPAVYRALTQTGRLRRLRTFAESRIGLQTLAGGFYVLTTDQIAQHGIEPEFLAPLAFSPREIKEPVLREGTTARHFVFLCDRPLEELEGMRALDYIRSAEKQRVLVRGAGGASVEGYHNAPRLKRAGRRPWYNLRSDVDRRGRWPIMIPRRVYESCQVVWNRAAWVANEDFIEVNPRSPADVPLMLAALSSSVGEFMMRSKGQMYGGGVINLNPDNVRYLPVLDLHSLGDGDRRTLEGAYREYLKKPHDRQGLDRVVLDLMGQPLEVAALDDAVQELRALATVSKERQS